MAQTPPGGNGFSLGLDWDTVLVILGAIGLFFKDKIWSFFTERVNRADSQKAQKEQQQQQAEGSSLQQVISTNDKMVDHFINSLTQLLTRIEGQLRDTHQKVTYTHTGLQEQRREWERIEQRDQDILDWMQRVDDRQEQIERQLVELLREVEETKRLIRPKKTPGIRDTQQSGKAVP